MILRALFLVIALTLTAAAVATASLFLFPKSHAPEHADAVALFVGGRGERLDTALRLVRAGVATNLVIPNGTVSTWPQANRYCRGHHSFEVYCPSPSPDNTRGEARAIAAEAHKHGWKSVLIVTSTYHVTRARLLLTRCYKGKISAVKAGPGLTPGRYAQRVAHEWAGLAEAVTVARTC